jgi:hypothetical protein
MVDVRIVPTADGPNMITGLMDLAWPSGHLISKAGEADQKVPSYCAAAVIPMTNHLATARTSESALNRPKAMQQPIVTDSFG